jgi:hypothetical protein
LRIEPILSPTFSLELYVSSPEKVPSERKAQVFVIVSGFCPEVRGENLHEMTRIRPLERDHDGKRNRFRF